jgi:hypothetical protein
MKGNLLKTSLPDDVIISRIFVIRNVKVMLDRDLAELYGVEARRLREQVKRNIGRFPPNFMFQLSNEEVDIMVSQNATPSKKHLGGSLPYAFTEHGVLMLANILKSHSALSMSIRLIEIFVKLREMVLTHKEILLALEKIEKKVTKHDDDIALIFEYVKQLLSAPSEPMRKIGFKQNNKN